MAKKENKRPKTRLWHVWLGADPSDGKLAVCVTGNVPSLCARNEDRNIRACTAKTPTAPAKSVAAPRLAGLRLLASRKP